MRGHFMNICICVIISLSRFPLCGTGRTLQHSASCVTVPHTASPEKPMALYFLIRI
ncbi:hypothetical protein C0J52_22158 [Blattella germanica]|nr:hypothetical protein C0J52_22158 [Blattella germanica]